MYFQGNVKNISSKAFSGVRCVELNFVKTIGENDRNRIKSIVRKDKKIFSENVSEVIDEKGDFEEISVSDIKENTEDINVIEIVEPSETTYTEENNNELLKEHTEDIAEVIEEANKEELFVSDISENINATEEVELTEEPDKITLIDESTEKLKESTENISEVIEEKVTDEEVVIDNIRNTPESENVTETISEEITYTEENNNERLKEHVEDIAEIIGEKTEDVKPDEDYQKSDDDTYDEIIIDKNSISKNKNSRTIVKKRTTVVENKEDLRKRDVKKYSSKISVCELKSDDSLISSLIEKYSILQNKYGYCLPIGMIDMTKEEYEKLTSYVYGYIIYDTPITSLTSFLSSVFMVKTVANYDHKNNFWSALATLLKSDENLIANYLKEALLYFCSSEKLYFHYYKNRHSYTMTVLIHSMINRHALNDVIEFIKDFYIEEMRESYSSDTIQSYINLFINEMVKDLEKNSDENISVSDIDGIYRISGIFKIACREFPEAVKDGLKCLIFNIDAYYHRTSDVSYSPVVFNKYFNRWKINDSLQRHIKSKSKESSDKSQIKAGHKQTKQYENLIKLQRCVYYINEDYKLYLYIPQQEISNEYVKENIYIRIFDNNENLPEYNQICNVYGMFRFHTEEVEIELGRFYRNLSIRIVSESGDVIFDSKSTLYRNYIVFDENLNEYSGRHMPDNRFYVLNDKADDFFADANYNTYKYSNYVIHSLDTDKETDIIIGTDNVFDGFDSDLNIKLFIDSKHLVKNVKAYVSGKEYKVYSDVPQIHCNAENGIDKYVIDINEYHLNAEDIFDDRTDTVFEPEKIFDMEKTSFICISLREKGIKKVICEWRIAVLTDFEYSLDKDWYYTERTVELLDLYAKNADFDLEDYPCSYLINSSRKITVSGKCNDRDFYIDIKIPVIYWEFNEEYNSLSGKKYIPPEILNNYSTAIMDLSLSDCSIWTINDTTQRKMSVHNKKLNLADFKNSGSEYTVIGLKCEQTGELKLFELIHKSSVRELSVNCDNNELCVSYIQIGKCPVNISIKNKDDEKVFAKSYSAQEYDKIYISENISELENGIYNVEISMFSADEFGFSVTKKLLQSFKITKGNAFEIYCQSKKGILRPYYCIFDGEIKKRANNFYCESISSNDNGESGIYTANAFFNNRYGDKVYLEDANPLRIELLEKNNNAISFTITDKDGDGLLYENARGYLCSDKIGIRDYSSYTLPDHYIIKI